jgi:hypothetical protein
LNDIIQRKLSSKITQARRLWYIWKLRFPSLIRRPYYKFTAKRILLYTDSRGEYIPDFYDYKNYSTRLSEYYYVDAYLCPEKWTTTLDFIELCKHVPLHDYDAIILHTGIVDVSPRHQTVAKQNIYEQKMEIFDEVFGHQQIQAYLNSDLGCSYEGDKTINMYSIEMARQHLIPRLKSIPNLIWIGINRIVPAWRGNYWKDRPANMHIVEDYARLFATELDRTIDLMIWDYDQIKNNTFDNIHLNKFGNDYVFEHLVIEIKEIIRSRSDEIIKQDSI